LSVGKEICPAKGTLQVREHRASNKKKAGTSRSWTKKRAGRKERRESRNFTRTLFLVQGAINGVNGRNQFQRTASKGNEGKRTEGREADPVLEHRWPKRKPATY